MDIGKNIKELRKEFKMTQIQLAAFLNVSNGTIGNWEVNRKTPDIEMLIKLADIFQVTLDELVGREFKQSK